MMSRIFVVFIAVTVLCLANGQNRYPYNMNPFFRNLGDGMRDVFEDIQNSFKQLVPWYKGDNKLKRAEETMSSTCVCPVLVKMVLLFNEFASTSAVRDLSVPVKDRAVCLIPTEEDELQHKLSKMLMYDSSAFSFEQKP
ncbi:hypothetical protein JTE90_024904 [Oedothorax gibbosus]|uniref:Uncharacterized protein n=1 Tax=Oedothorax gibbosus TaxID=931172 RepID=A0AAV6U5K1_9ARAC|nr:hypothetical protein JTE90_024904 [Oedothorax gibbosus]